MYICDRCGELVDDDEIKTYKEHYPYGETCAEQDFISDCSCGGDFVEAEICELCGEYAPKDDISDGLCEKCREETLKSFTELLNANFFPAQIDFLKENWI